jgi:hypothetical protein
VASGFSVTGSTRGLNGAQAFYVLHGHSLTNSAARYARTIKTSANELITPEQTK